MKIHCLLHGHTYTQSMGFISVSIISGNPVQGEFVQCEVCGKEKPNSRVIIDGQKREEITQKIDSLDITLDINEGQK